MIAKKGKTEKINFANMVVPSHIHQLSMNVFAAEEKHFQDFVECFLNKVVTDKNDVSVFPNVKSGSKVNVSFFNKQVQMGFYF